MKNPEFLSQKYQDLPGSKPVEKAVQKELRKGEKGAKSKEDRVEAYLDRWEDIASDKRGFELLKYKILKTYVTKPEDIPERYWKVRKQEARRRGEGADWAHATEERMEENKKEHTKTVLHDQRASLEQWVDYFGSSDSEHIPKELKYWIFRNIVKLQELVKIKDKDGNEHIKFNKRSKGTVKPFPDINYEALSYVVDAVVEKLADKQIDFEHDIQEDERQKFLKALNKTDFAKLYAWANELHNPVPEHLLPITEGEWVKYDQGSDPDALVKTIRGKGTGWCTAGLNTAKTQLQGGDFYVYYTLDDDKKPTIPRLAIRMDGQEEIAEDPRGIAYKQNLDPYMTPVLDEKLKEFGSVGEQYKKKTVDMKRLTEIEVKVQADQELNRDDLVFLYEIDSKIEGFGFKKDPRVKEFRDARDPEADMPIVFECEPEQIARSVKLIIEDTKAYVGPLEPGIFQKIVDFDIEQVYTSFPERRITRQTMEVGGKTRDELLREMKDKDITISDYAKVMMKQKDFITSDEAEDMDLIRLSGADLNIEGAPSTNAIYAHAKELGLELVPAEVGLHYGLKTMDQAMGDSVYMGMKQIAGPDYPSVFDLFRGAEGGLWLDGVRAHPGKEWDPSNGFVFRLRKSES